MALTPLDWIVVAVYGAVVLAIGFGFARRAGGSMEDYFVAGRSLPWWLAGTSIAATWFASDAPLATAALVRQQGIYGNWLWWYEAAGVLMLTFFYARLWRRAGVLTDAEVIEIRYGGAPARVLRGFSAIYQGLIKNGVVMGWVMLAMMKFSSVLLGWDPAPHPDRLRGAGAGLHRGLGVVGRRGHGPAPVHGGHARGDHPRRHRADALRRPRRHGRRHRRHPHKPLPAPSTSCPQPPTPPRSRWSRSSA